MKKVILIIVITVTAIILGVNISANMNVSYTGMSTPSKNISAHDVNSNFFTQVDSKEEMDLPEEIRKQNEFLETHNYKVSNQVSSSKVGYELVAETNDLALYLYSDTIAIAIVDKATGYTWFSNYYDQDTLGLTSANIATVESGVSIEYYNSHSAIVNGNNRLAFTEGKRVNLNLVLNTVTYADYKLDNKTVGFIASVNFVNVGISFDVEVYLDNNQLVVNVPHTSVVEVASGTNGSERNLLRTISLFPYLGSQNYEVNGYSFLPDGSGSLVRYTEEVGTSSFVRAIYGNDYGYYTDPDNEDHLTDPYNLSLPIYGISHGYHQQAILAQVTSGFGQAELHSYPYMYSGVPLDRTYFKFLMRHDTYFQLSSGPVMIINEKVYQNDCTVVYDFLSNDDANYVGMAETYRETLNVTLKEESDTIPLHLDVLAMDYKPGLFGKNYVKLTTHEQVEEIATDLLSKDINNVSINYFGSNKEGYFTKTSNLSSYSTAVGNIKSLTNLNTFLSENNYELSLGFNPVVTTEYGFLSDAVKKPNYEPFAVDVASSIKMDGYYNDPTVLSKNVNKVISSVSKTNIDLFTIYDISKSYSYLDNKNYSKEEMILQVVSQLNSINVDKINAHTPNDYLLEFVNSYLDTPYESSKFSFQTDSVPFISILLSGYMDLFISNINYISNYDLMNLRMVEYNLYPSFVVTKAASFNLRYTNFEYLNSTEYALWSSLIDDTYHTINDALDSVYNSTIIGHSYIAPGVAEVVYSNNTTIYINYTNQDYIYNNKTIGNMNYLVEVQ